MSGDLSATNGSIAPAAGSRTGNMRPLARFVLAVLTAVVAPEAAASTAIGAGPAPAVRVFACPPIEPMPRDMAIATRYAGPSVDPTFSTYVEAKVEAQKVERSKFDRPVMRINMLSEQYSMASDKPVKTAIGDCLIRHFSAIPESGAMEGADTVEDRYYRDWMVTSLAISYLRAEEAFDANSSTAAIVSWFERMTRDIRQFYAGRTRSRGLDNHTYWGAAAVAAAGLLNADRSAMEFARGVLGAALDGVDADGVLVAEMKRGRKARHYHLFALIPLSAAAILLEATLTDTETTAYRRLVDRTLEGFEAPARSLFVAKTGVAQDAGHVGAIVLVAPLVSDEPALVARVTALARDQRPVSYFLGGSLQFLLDRAYGRREGTARDGRVGLHRDGQRTSGLSAGCVSGRPICGVMEGGRSPTGVTSHIGGQFHAAIAKER